MRRREFLPSNSVRLRSIGRYDCFARELRDYYDGALRATSSAAYARTFAALRRIVARYLRPVCILPGRPA